MIQQNLVKCQGLVGKIFGHKFTPVFSHYTSADSMTGQSQLSEYWSVVLCPRCGTLLDAGGLENDGDNDMPLPTPDGDELRVMD